MQNNELDGNFALQRSEISIEKYVPNSYLDKYLEILHNNHEVT